MPVNLPDFEFPAAEVPVFESYGLGESVLKNLLCSLPLHLVFSYMPDQEDFVTPFPVMRAEVLKR